MNAAKVTLTATILAAALGLALGLMGAPAMADKPDPVLGHDHGDESEDATIFDVSLEYLVDTETGLSATLCLGTTDILANPGLSVDFEAGCTVDMSVNIPDSNVFAMSLFRLEVKTKGSGVTEVVLNFRDDVFIPTNNTSIWITDRLSAMVTMPVDGVFSLSTETPPLVGFILTKGHQPHKGAMTTQGLLIGRFIYSPVVPDG